MNKGTIVIAKTTSQNDESYQTREEGKAYKVMDTLTCNGCGLECINIGETSNLIIMECSCGHNQNNYKKKWTSVEHFEEFNVDLLSSKNKNAVINFALEDENYELLTQIRDYESDRRLCSN